MTGKRKERKSRTSDRVTFEKAARISNIKNALAQGKSELAKDYISAYLAKGLLAEADVRDFRRQIHKQKYG